MKKFIVLVLFNCQLDGDEFKLVQLYSLIYQIIKNYGGFDLGFLIKEIIVFLEEIVFNQKLMYYIEKFLKKKQELFMYYSIF